MAEQSKYEILITAVDDASPKIDDVGDSLGDVEKKGKKTKKGVDDLTPSFLNLAGAVGIGSLAADKASQAISALGGFLKSTVTEALAAQSAWAGYEQILISGSGASSEQINMLKAQADALERVGVISGDVIMATQGTLATFDLQAESIQTLIPAFVDMIAKERGMNATTQDAISFGNAFGKVLMGNVGALSDYGFKFDEATEKILKTGTETEKITALTELLNSTYEGMNDTLANTTEGRLKRLDTAFGDLKKNIGNQLIPTIDLFAKTLLGSTQEMADASSESVGFSRDIYTLGSVIKGLGYFVLGTARLIGTFALSMVKSAVVAYNWAKDIVNHFKSVSVSAKDVFAAFALGVKGDFIGASLKISEALKLNQIDFSNTGREVDNLEATVEKSMEGVYDAFKKGGSAISEGVIQAEFKAVSEVSKNVKEQAKEDMGSIQKEGKKTANTFKNAAEKIASLSKSTADSLTDISETFIEKSGDMYDAYLKKVADINKSILSENEAFEKGNIQAKEEYNDRVLALFMEEQDTRERLLKDKQRLDKRMAEGGGDPESFDEQKALEAQIRASDARIAQFKKENDELERLSTEEREKTGLDKLKEQFATEQEERQKEHAERLAELQLRLDEEKAVYEKNKQELIADTIDKYQKIGEKLNEGWTKMKEDTKGHVKEMQVLEAQVLAIKASIEAARAAVSMGGVGGEGSMNIEARAEGGPVVSGRPYVVGERGPELFVPSSSGSIVPNGGGATQIHIMEGASVSIRSQGDIDALANAVSTHLARVLQQRRSGLATSS